MPRKAKVQFVVGMLTYLAIVTAGAIALNEQSSDASRWAVAVGSILAALVWLTGTIRFIRRTTEVDRFISLESTSIAFFVTMVSVLTYALLESWIELPKLSMWFPWTVGMGTWAILTIVVKRKVS